jgi:uncharacterized protein (DUF1810 family)
MERRRSASSSLKTIWRKCSGKIRIARAMSEDATSDDPFALERFVAAQAGTYMRACDELRGGRKRSHWMWYVFPQLRGLALSRTSYVYGIDSIAEARAYLAHPVLGPRLAEVTGLMLALRGRPLREILGSPDDMKFRSSMTLFSRADGPNSIFAEALEKLCNREPDERTLALLQDD